MKVKNVLKSRDYMLDLINNVPNLNNENNHPYYCIGDEVYVKYIYRMGILLEEKRSFFGGGSVRILIAPNRLYNIRKELSCLGVYALDSEGFITVWDNGKWIKKGPWEKHIKNFIEFLLLEADIQKSSKDRENRDMDQKLLDSWE